MTVTTVGARAVTVWFDNGVRNYQVDKVRSRFLVMGNFYVYRQQFLLILAYAITMHKSQGLSLDCAIMDLFEQVFCPGMTYVALSRVKALSGVHLISFDVSSIMVGSESIQDINRLCALYRPDLPSYSLSVVTKKRPFTECTDQSERPNCKKPRLAKMQKNKQRFLS